MSYDVDLRAKVEGYDKYVCVTDGHNITWNVRELIEASSGWVIKNMDNNGSAEGIGAMIEHGIEQLEKCPENYRSLEAGNGWGTIDCVLNFYRGMLEDCKEHPYAYVFVY